MHLTPALLFSSAASPPSCSAVIRTNIGNSNGRRGWFWRRYRGRSKLVFNTHGPKARLALKDPAPTIGQLQIQHAVYTLTALRHAEDLAGMQDALGPGAIDLRRGARMDGIGHGWTVAPNLWNHHWAALPCIAAAPYPLFVGCGTKIAHKAIEW